MFVEALMSYCVTVSANQSKEYGCFVYQNSFNQYLISYKLVNYSNDDIDDSDYSDDSYKSESVSGINTKVRINLK